MARRFHHVSPGRLQIREGGGCLAVFGLPFFAAGVFLLLSAVGVVPIGNANEVSGAVWPIMAVMGIVFTGVGGALVFGRSWTTIDRDRRRIIKQWGLLTPLREQTFPMEQYTAVRLGFDRGDSDTADRFPVVLKARAGTDLPLFSFTDHAESRECAVEVARHLGLEIEDATTDHPSRLSPGRPFSEPVWRDRVPPQAAARPPEARSTVSRDADGVRIVIPRSRNHPIVLAAGLIPMTIALWFAPSLARFFRETRTPNPIEWALLAGFIGFFGLLPLTTVLNGFLRSRRGRTIVTVSAQGLRIQERGAWRTVTVASFDAQDILDVDYSTSESAIAMVRRAVDQKVLESHGSVPAAVVPRMEGLLTRLAKSTRGRGLTIKTLRGLTTFAEGLDDAETRYLYAVVLHGLRGDAAVSGSDRDRIDRR